jgi:uncharacterized membrane protein YeaQ/YmgE (transglycosylase-associated protein family)
MEIVWLLLVGLIAGWLAGQIVKGGGYGMIGDMVVGVVGALIGGYVFRSLGLSHGQGLLGSIVVATIGAIILIVLLRIIKRV